ncbi:alanine racemase [Microlunatus endophyticus]|uniref:Alanine racemase n=1 Tax=Microlunatus endophyticus TaxID=1716077 RepID=A0A917SEJ0_9ACTN|nr:alanine racemase [Microlunatus endophyticus]GGL74646.1 alanine racemase [Microlunatus endophyticus]
MTRLDAVRGHLIELDVRDKNWSATLAAAQCRGPEVDLGLDELSTPIFTLDLDDVDHNITTMQSWVTEHGASIAPHGKTTMCPALWSWQLQQGAWAITVANEAQLRVARDAGIGRVVVANEFLSPQGLAWLAREQDSDPDFEVITWVDSAEGVRLMTEALTAAGAERPLSVCLEIGHPKARAGVRDHDDALAIARAVVESPRLQLRGIAGYEGSVPGEGDQRIAGVRSFLTAMGELVAELSPLVETDEVVITAGGSALFDLVVEILGPIAAVAPNARLVLRSGAYVVHDDGTYKRSTPAATRTGPVFVAAAHVWARVISHPEADLVLLDVGKRDIPYDAGLPVVQKVVRDGDLVDAPAAEVFNTNDQHAYVRLSEPGSLAVGEVVRLGLSHPCTMFDKWRSALLVENDRVRGAIPTYF